MRRLENRKRFFARISPVLPPGDLHDVELAYLLAKHAHRWQKRRELDEHGQPRRYFEHLRRTALIAIDIAGIIEPTIIVSALLHDGLEDTREITPELLEHLFGHDIAGIVRRLTKRPKRGYVERLRKADWRTLLVKACDRLDNLRSLEVRGVPRDFRERQKLETREKYLELFDLLVLEAPTRHRAAIERIRDEIRWRCQAP